MKKTLFLFSLFLLLCSNTFIDSQSEKPLVATKVSISELTVIDSVVLKGIDRFILDFPCKVRDSYKYFMMRVTKMLYQTGTLFTFILYDKIEMAQSMTPIGYFEYKGYTFIVLDHYFNDIFMNSETKKDFLVYKVVNSAGLFNFWKLSLEDGEIQLEAISCGISTR